MLLVVLPFYICKCFLSAWPWDSFFPYVVEGELDWKLGGRGSGPRYESSCSSLVKLGHLR